MRYCGDRRLGSGALRGLLERLGARLRDEEGIALVVALGVIVVLSLASATAIQYTAANARSAARSSADGTAYSLAEAGVNNAISILRGALQPTTPTLLTGLPVYQFTTGTATVSGTISGTTWTITSTGTVRNPTGPTAPDATRTLIRQVTVQGLASGSSVSAWSRIYNDDNTACMTIPAGVVIPSNFATRGNLCLDGSSIIGASTTVDVGGTVTMAPGASAATAATPTGTGAGWTNPSRITANDNSVATTSVAANSDGATLTATNFGFQLPSNAVVTGVTVTYERWASATNTLKDVTIQLLKNGVATGSNKGPSAYWSNASQTVTLGSSSDTWGAALDGNDVDQATFGIKFVPHNYTGAAATASADYVAMTLNYYVDSSIGSASTAVQQANVAGTCKWSTLAAHTPCTATDHVWGASSSVTPQGLAKPTVDFNYWYNNAAPGPKHGCDVKSGTPPDFDNNSVYDNSLGATNGVYEELTPEPGPKDTPPGTSSSTAYTCIAKNAQGQVIGQLSWNNMTRVLTVSGTIFIDGDAYFHDHNGYVVHYQGKATIYIAGNWHNDEAVCAGGSGLTTCRTPAAISTWDPSQNMLVLAIGDKNAAGSADFDFHTDFSAFQGVLWSKNDCKIREGAYMSGPVLCNKILITPSGKDATDVPLMAAWPPLGSLLPGQLYGSSSTSPDFLIAPGQQTGG